MNFFLSFIETLLHSIWQAALLLGIYWVINIVERNYHPLHKRNFLYLLLLSQFCISIFTFLSFFNGYSFAVTIGFTNSFQQFRFGFLFNYYNVVFMVYMSIVIIKMLQIIFHWSVFKKSYGANLVRPTAALNVFTKYHAHQLSLKQHVTLWFSNSIKTPVTFGFFKPVILIPISLINNITSQQAEIIILHELIHIKSKDYLLNWFLITMETIYFFNPFIKIVAEKLKLEREKNCDIQVLNYQYGAVPYAETLYEIAQNNSFLQRFQLGVFKNNAQLYKRIRFFSDERNLSFKKFSYSYLTIGLAVLIGSISSVMIAKRSYSNNKSEKISIKTFEESFQDRKINTASVIKEEDISTQQNNYLAAKKTIRASDHTEPTFTDLEASDGNELTYIPVSLNETIDSAKEIIYYVESNSATITQSYKLINKNGNWVFIPQWMIKVTKDTISPNINIDSTFLIPLKEVQ